MIRVLILLVIVAAVWGLRWYMKAPADVLGKRLGQLAWVAVGLVLAVLLLSGKLNGLIALVGVLFAFLMRSMPVILKYAPQLQSLWQRFKTGQQEQAGGRSRPTVGMDKAKAFEILGLKPGASQDEIIQAHRKLISRVHPDRGGSDYLAAQINQAKKVLLGR